MAPHGQPPSDDRLRSAERSDVSERGQPGSRPWAVLAVLGTVQLMVVLDATIVNIALPSAQAGLGISDADRHWVITAYSLALGGLLLLGGRITDRTGARRVLLVGLAGFAAASVLAGTAPAGWVLFAGRALQGVFAALLAPAALSLLSTTFQDPKQRSAAFGVFGAVSGGGAAVGLLIGGLLTEYLSWRWCLYVNVPIALVALVGGVAWLPGTPRRVTGQLDLPGVVLSCTGLVAIVLGFAQAEPRGWGDPFVLSLLLGGTALLAVLLRVESRVSRPLLPLPVLMHRARGGAFLIVGLSQVAMFGFFLFITYYLQAILGYSPVWAGVAFLPLSVATVVGSSVIAARLLHRTGPRPLMTGGLVLAAAGMAGLTQLGPDSSGVYLTFLMPIQVAIGLGLGLVLMPAVSTATAEVSEDDSGVASALVNAAQQIGGAMGTALLNTVSNLVTAANLEAGLAAATVQGYATAIAIATAVLALTAVLGAVMLPRQAPVSTVDELPGAAG